MKLLCETNIIRRSNREIKTRFIKSTLAIGKKDEKSNLCIILISSSNKAGTKYDLTNNIAGIFRKFLNEGKCTISFQLPEIDLQIKADPIQLKAFLNVIKNELYPSKENDKDNNHNNLIRAFASTTKMLTDQVTKLIITQRSEFPTKGFPRTLKELHINEIGCSQMPIGILNLSNLTYLNLNNNKIEKIHRALGNLRINELSISENDLGKSMSIKDWEWFNGINLQQNLRTLNLSKNKLKFMPSAIAKFESLVNLDLSNNEISRLPFAIKQMKSMRNLNLSHNQLKSLPCTIRKLQLDLIDLSSNQFSSYSKSLEIAQQSQRNITALNLDFPTLFELASQIIIKKQIPFMSLNIPKIIKEILFHSPICCNTKCESLCYDRKIYSNINITEIKSKSRITSDNTSHFLVDGPLCKITCLKF
ncbi:hypothetical protein PVAND_001213 [Polypedilum vanderplanki]|uniref:PIF1/LRR1 pleckstrin homology domain-containing protein n=1 Tax=Polypedilum vanderplanki TaxID=319348 RepID=A0A9J6BM96_POLVA|nr:hypothetical protein PVAND_001213 [Polypedilum vanderplanki]